MDRSQKAKLVEGLHQALSDTVCVVVTHQNGMTVEEVTTLRRQMRAVGAGFKVTDVGNLSIPDVAATTVYYTDADDEHATADAVGQKLSAPVQPRIPALTNQPPGVIVLVTG